MSALDRLAERMFGRQRLETTAAMASVDTQTYIGVATSDSADGSVSVVLSDDVTQPDNGIWDGDTFLASDELGTSVELPTTTAVRKGDRVLVTASGANVMATPVVTGVVGRGDEQQAQIDAAAEAAASVEGIAQEALDGVEQVRQDVADFRDDVATTYATKVERQDGDDALRTFITTNYTNSNDLATTYATKTLVSQTKDAIELAASQTYETQSDAAATYATKSALTVGLNGIRTEVAEDYQPKGDYATTASMNSAIQQSASSIESSVAATYETQSDAAATYATKTEVQQTASGLDTRITTAQSTADGAYLERTATGTTIDTTGAATIRSLVVEGQSVQDGTPTPSAPVPIESVAAPNLTPFFSHDLTDVYNSSTNPNGYWRNAGARNDFTQLEDGWAHFEKSGVTSTVNYYFSTTNNVESWLKPSTTYTALIELRNVTLSGGTYAQVYASTGSSAALPVANTGGWTESTVRAAYLKTVTTGSDVTSQTYAANGCVQLRGTADSPQSLSCDLRISLYEGTYTGRYVPVGCIGVSAGSTTVPIDLQGNALRSLPDGTHDEMRVAADGSVTLVKRVGVFDTSLLTQYAANNGFIAYKYMQLVSGGTSFRSNLFDKSESFSSSNMTKECMQYSVTHQIFVALSDTRPKSDLVLLYKLATPQTIDLGTIDLPTPADTLWLDAAIVPTIEATWWTVDGIAGQQTLDAEVTERQTLIRQFSGGVLAGYVGNAIAALVNAAGSFDVVRTAWADGVPSILGTLATFGANLIRIGGEFAASGRSTAKVQFFEDNSALTDLTAEHYIDTTTDPQVSHSLALSSTTTDDELPDGTSRTVTGNVEVWEQIYHSGSTYRDEVVASLNGMTTNSQNNVSMGVQAIESSDASSQRVAFVTADTVRLTSGTGEQSMTSDFTMPQVTQALNCRSNTNGWVTSDLYPNTNRAIYVGARVNNSSSSVNGHDISLYLGPAGLNLYDATAGRTLWNIGIINTHFAVWPGTKVLTVSNASSFTLFTKAQLQAIVGTDWTPTGANCSVFVMNGDHGASANMMSASIDASSVVRVHMNAARNGALRVNYLIIRFA